MKLDIKNLNKLRKISIKLLKNMIKKNNKKINNFEKIIKNLRKQIIFIFFYQKSLKD